MHTDLIDLNIRPRGIVPIWVLISLTIFVAKLTGAPINWWLVAAIPVFGLGLLNLLLIYGILEALQKDTIYLWRKISDDQHGYNEPEICETCGLPIEHK